LAASQVSWGLAQAEAWEVCWAEVEYLHLVLGCKAEAVEEGHWEIGAALRTFED